MKERKAQIDLNCYISIILIFQTIRSTWHVESVRPRVSEKFLLAYLVKALLIHFNGIRECKCISGLRINGILLWSLVRCIHVL